MEANATTGIHGNAMDDSSKAELVPPKRPQRTLSDEDFNNEVSQNDASAGDNNDGGSGGNDEDEEGDEDIIEEADKRSKFMMKGGSHSIQKVLKGEARKKKGLSRFDRRALAPKKGTATIPVPASKAVSKAPPAPSKAEEETAAQSQAAKPQQPVDAAIMESLGDSHSENIYDSDDGEEFAAEVERRSKFIAKGGSHSIKKVLAGEARSGAGKSGPSRINRRNIQPKASPADDEEVEEVEESSGVDNEELDNSSARRAAPGDGPRTPMRTISCDSTDSQIEDEASRRSMFMLKGASHSIRNLLSGKAKKEKRGSALDRRKLHFKHEADAVHYTETQHAKPEEINAARLRAEAEAKAKLKAKKTSRFGKRKGTRPVPSAAASKDDPSSVHDDDPSSVHDDTSNKGLDDSDAALEAEADRRALMFKGGSHSIRNLFAGKTKKKDSSINRFNRRKMSLRVEADAVHYTEKPHLKPAEINARHQEEAARLRAQAEAQAAAKKAPSTAAKNENKAASAPPRVPRRTVTERESSQLDDEEEVADVPPADLDDDTDADDDILEEADKRSKFMMKGGSYSIQKVLKGEARAKKGVTRFDRRKMHFNKASEAVHSHVQEAEDQAAAGETAPETEPSANNDDSDYDLDNDSDADLLEEADKRSKFMMKGGSHSIQKVLRGEARVKKEGVTRFDRRKMHFNKAAAGASNPEQKDEPEPEPELEPEPPAEEGDSDYDLENDSDADLLEEADKRSKFMMKGGSYSIQKVLRGDARVKKEGVTRVDRRKMHFKKASEAVHSHDNDSQNQQTHSPVDQSNEAPPAQAGEDDSDYDLENDSDADILEEADKRSKFMMKGGSYSIQKVLRGDARKKEGVSRFDRRKMHFNKASEAVHSHDNDQQPPATTDQPNQDPEPQAGEEDSDYDLDNDSDADLIEEADKRSKFMMKGGSHSIQKVLRGEARVKKEGVTRFDRRKMHFNKASEAVHSHDNEGSEKENNDSKAALDESDGSAGSVEYDEDDADIIEEADKRSKFMMKGGSHSIQKVLRGEARAKKGVAVSRLDRRKMHFNKASAGVERAKQPMMADESNTSVKSSDSAPRAPPRRRVSDDSEEDDDEDADADIIEEADKRSKFMTKGGSYSIQKVLRGEARQKKEGITRFDRRKMHFKHEAEAVHCHDNDPKPQDQPPRRPPARTTTETEEDASKQGDDSEFDEEELALLAEAEKDPRQMMMLKGASHSIRNIFSGKAKKKENVGAGMQRRKSQLTAHKAPSRPADVASVSESIAQDEEVSVSTRGDDDKSVDRRSRFTLKGASNSIRNLLRRPKKEYENESSTPPEVTTRSAEAKDEPSNEVDKDEDNDLDDDDADIIEEADRRSNFMAKGGSYSIQKVLRGNARKKNTGITRFDRRKMHFKKESEAIHSHDNERQQGKEDQDASPAEPQAKEAGEASPEAERVDTDATADYDLDLDDDEDADLIEEADRRSKFMSKGGSYSIQKVLKGEARAKKGVSRFDRRKMHFKKEAQAVHSHDSDATPQTTTPVEAQTNKPQSELLDALASGAPAKGTASSAANAKMPSRRVSDGMEDENSAADAGEEDDAEPDRRSRFTLKGASHSIKKVLAGKARAKKESGVSRLDRRRIHLKSKSTPRGDLPPGK